MFTSSRALLLAPAVRKCGQVRRMPGDNPENTIGIRDCIGTWKLPTRARNFGLPKWPTVLGIIAQGR